MRIFHRILNILSMFIVFIPDYNISKMITINIEMVDFLSEQYLKT